MASYTKFDVPQVVQAGVDCPQCVKYLNDQVNLFLNQIIFLQRPLVSRSIEWMWCAKICRMGMGSHMLERSTRILIQAANFIHFPQAVLLSHMWDYVTPHAI